MNMTSKQLKDWFDQVRDKNGFRVLARKDREIFKEIIEVLSSDCHWSPVQGDLWQPGCSEEWYVCGETLQECTMNYCPVCGRKARKS